MLLTAECRLMIIVVWFLIRLFQLLGFHSRARVFSSLYFAKWKWNARNYQLQVASREPASLFVLWRLWRFVVWFRTCKSLLSINANAMHADCCDSANVTLRLRLFCWLWIALGSSFCNCYKSNQLFLCKQHISFFGCSYPKISWIKSKVHNLH